MKVSIGGYSFQNTMLAGKMDTFGYLETCRYRYGMDVVDLWNGTFEGVRQDIFSLPEDSFINKLKEALEERELKVANIAVDGAHLWDADPDRRAMLLRNAQAYLKIAALLGAESIRVDTGDKQSVPGSEEQFEYTVKQFQLLSAQAADLGIIIGPENHMGTSKHPAYLKRVAEAVNHPSFGILLHMDRWDSDSEIGDSLVAPWVYHTHFDGKTAASPRAEQLVRTLLDVGYKGYWGIEYNAPENQYLEMQWAIAAVKKILVQANKS